MNKNILVLGTLTIAITIFGLFQVKYKVYNLKKDLMEIEHQLDADKDAIRVLKAEWAYLNKPERIEKLANKYLHLENMQVAQVYNSNQVANVYVASFGNQPNISVSNPTLSPTLSSVKETR